MIFTSDTAIFIKKGGDCGLFRIYSYADGRAEVEIMVYRQGHRHAAVDGLLHGGRMPSAARASDTSLFFQLVKKGISLFSQAYRLTWEAPDTRRSHCYARMLKKAGIAFSKTGNFFELS